MRFLVIGGTGLLGQALNNEISKRGYTCLTFARKNADFSADITDYSKIEKIIEDCKFDYVINACAIINLEYCDNNYNEALKINSLPNYFLTQLSKKHSFKYIYISTDGYYKGDGNIKHNEDFPVSIFNKYAETKFLGEALTLYNDNSLVVRTNIVGIRNWGGKPTFFEWVLESLKLGLEINMFDDYYTSSISTFQFSKALIDLLSHNPRGLINIASSDVFTKKDFIVAVAKRFGYSLEKANNAKLSQFGKVNRPDSLGLDTQKVESILGYKMPSLDEVVEQLYKETYEI